MNFFLVSAPQNHLIMKRANTFLPCLFFICCSLNIHAQVRNCGTMSNLQLLLQQDEQLAENMHRIEQFTQQWVSAHPQGSGARAVYAIPVVVHIVYNTTTENISDAQVQSQLAALNKDFSRTNTDAGNTPSVWQSIAANTDIQFCLATLDPSGNVTTGITRTSTAVTSFTENNNVKFTANGGKDAWAADKYLNIWVCDLSGLIGYAQFPGGAVATDGVVVDYQAFGTTGTASAPFHLGRTATHEIGHWLNLKHIWGDDAAACTGSDLVGDTPNHADENFGCPVFPVISCSNAPNGDMFMNYMDYSNDACMNLFTIGQKARMQALFATGGYRNSLLTSNGCATALVPVVVCNIPSGLYASNITAATAKLNWSAASGATAYSVRFKATASSLWVTGNTSGNSWSISGLAQGTQYEFQVKTSCETSSSAYSSSALFSTASSGCSDAFEPNDNRTTAVRLPSGLSGQAQISSATDADWYRFGNTSSKRNIKITLTDLPANYNVALYSSSGVLLRQSVNTGTGSETITYNNGSLGTYYVYVYGYSGAFSSSQCYALAVQLSSSTYRVGNENARLDKEDQNFIERIYPNPADAYLIVEFASETECLLDCKIFDINGKTVLSSEYSISAGKNELALNTTSLSNGVYLLRVHDGKNIHSRRFLAGD